MADLAIYLPSVWETSPKRCSQTRRSRRESLRRRHPCLIVDYLAGLRLCLLSPYLLYVEFYVLELFLYDFVIPLNGHIILLAAPQATPPRP
jgi:hypothetical protein